MRCIKIELNVRENALPECVFVEWAAFLAAIEVRWIPVLILDRQRVWLVVFIVRSAQYLRQYRIVSLAVWTVNWVDKQATKTRESAQQPTKIN